MCNIMMTYQILSAAAKEFAQQVRKLHAVLENFEIARKSEGDEAIISFLHNGCTIQVMVGESWLSLNMITYFVNVTHPNGNFMAQAGAVDVLETTLNLGVAIQFAHAYGDVNCDLIL
jgi:hypothetical protein